ncbi:uncharacterized protein LOC128210988 isoform X2 [Mya arenaria]|uniref:uncharacterized protein LOC128210988 isoform X2 n=1 Tax=Mya arenaria TaxID=6604 RepID=UPI0022E5BDF6|nr:uncharacterized protein LOC128210988 isoform X2 [Mya arenaria]
MSNLNLRTTFVVIVVCRIYAGADGSVTIISSETTVPEGSSLTLTCTYTGIDELFAIRWTNNGNGSGRKYDITIKQPEPCTIFGKPGLNETLFTYTCLTLTILNVTRDNQNDNFTCQANLNINSENSVIVSVSVAGITLSGNGTSGGFTVGENASLQMTCSTSKDVQYVTYVKRVNGSHQTITAVGYGPSSCATDPEPPSYLSCSCVSRREFVCVIRNVNRAMNGDIWLCTLPGAGTISGDKTIVIEVAGITLSGNGTSGGFTVGENASLQMTCSTSKDVQYVTYVKRVNGSHQTITAVGYGPSSCATDPEPPSYLSCSCVSRREFVCVIRNVNRAMNGDIWLCTLPGAGTISGDKTIVIEVAGITLSGNGTSGGFTVGENASLQMTCSTSKDVQYVTYVKRVNGSHQTITAVGYGPSSCATDPEPPSYLSCSCVSRREFVCVIRNVNRAMNGDIWLCTLPGAGTISGDKTIVIEDDTQNPEISAPSVFTVIEGQEFINTECKSNCWPDCTYRWINSSSNTVIAANFTLFFHTVTRYFTGNYTCVSTNNATRDKTESKIYILVQYAPDVTVIGSNATSMDIQTQLRCSARGNPDIYTYKWQQKWPNSILTRNWTLHGYSVLNLTDLSYEHSGRFTCFASNGVPHFPDMNTYRSSSTFMFVKDVPVVVSPKTTNSGPYMIFTNLKETVELNITVFSNNGLISMTISTIHDHKNLTSFRTIDEIIQLPVFGTTVPSKGYLISITFYLGDTSDFTAYNVVFTNEIGSVFFAVEIKQKETSESSIGPLIGGVTGGVFVVVVLVVINIYARHIKQDGSTTRDEVFSVEENHSNEHVGIATERPEYTELKKDTIGQASAYDDLTPPEVNGEYEISDIKQDRFTTRDEASFVEANHSNEQVGTATERPEYTELKQDTIGQANTYDDLTPPEGNGEYENTVTVTQTGVHFYNN